MKEFEQYMNAFANNIHVQQQSVAVPDRNRTLFRNAIIMIRSMLVALYLSLYDSYERTCNKEQQQDDPLPKKQPSLKENRSTKTVRAVSIITFRDLMSMSTVAIKRSRGTFSIPVSLWRRFSFRRRIPLTVGA